MDMDADRPPERLFVDLSEMLVPANFVAAPVLARGTERYWAPRKAIADDWRDTGSCSGVAVFWVERWPGGRKDAVGATPGVTSPVPPLFCKGPLPAHPVPAVPRNQNGQRLFN